MAGTRLTALPSGALWWSEMGVLCVSGLRLGNSGRFMHNIGTIQPPSENKETLTRLERDILQRNPQSIICLGDSFDNLATAEEMDPADHRWLTCLMAGRDWVWIPAEHRPGPVAIGGTYRSAFHKSGLVFRHLADANDSGEISGHFNPKTTVLTQGQSRVHPCFLIDENRVVLPIYGSCEGVSRNDAPVLRKLMLRDSVAVLTGARVRVVPAKY